MRRAKPIPRFKLVELARLLALDRAWINCELLGTDIDVLGIKRKQGEWVTIAIEVKAAVHERNIDHTIRQLDFRANFFDYVYLATRADSLYYALMLVPLEYGVIDISSMVIVRRSKRFDGHYHEYMKRYLLYRA